ncbi:MAG: hypothetical protein M3157_01505 [Actinomycetota bacterium]|nr:hypothetical protein [Actinomycetota bacterium]
MRGALAWTAGAVLAFLATAGAFLLLANLSSTLSSRSVEPEPAPSDTVPLLGLELSESRLEELEKESGQILPLTVENSGGSDLRDINLTMRVASEDTARPGTRYYRATIKELAAGESKTVRFTLDLSPPDRDRGARPSSEPEPRSVLEAQATTPEGISAVKTAVLPL